MNPDTPAHDTTSKKRFRGRVALVTGGSRGIGRACVMRLAQEGADVAVNYVSQAQAAEETAVAARALGVRAITVAGDVSSPDAVSAMVSAVETQLGPIDLLVNNAGVFDFVTHEQTTAELWNRTIAINLTGTYLVTWAVKESMIARQFGRIVNLSSIMASRGLRQLAAYSATKGAVSALTRSLAVEYAPFGIRVNFLAPGFIETALTERVLKNPRFSQVLLDQTPNVGEVQCTRLCNAGNLVFRRCRADVRVQPAR